MKLLLLRIMLRLFSWITPRGAEFIAPPVAAILWYLSPRKRRVTRLNLRAVYPDMDAAWLNEIARSSMTQYVRGVFEAGMLWHWPLDRIFSHFDEPEGIEQYLEAERMGKGVIMAGGHCGSWELLGFYMQQYQKGAILYKPGKHPDVEEMLLEKRRRGGATMVPASSAGLRTMFKLLKAHQSVALVVDQEPTLGEGQFAPFYGIETLTGVLLPRMSQRTGAPIMFGVCERRKGGRYCVHAFKADEDMYSSDMRVALTALNRSLEKCIEVDTTQNLWAYKRFRNRPEGEQPFYKKGS
jgi:KDO2-lipid IV(A) lauroyltransferase